VCTLLQSLITSITTTFPVQLCRSQAYAKCQCMYFRVAQRSMSHTKQSMYIERARTHTHTIFRERKRAQSMYISTHTPYLERERAHTHTPYILQKVHTRQIFYRRGDKTFLCVHKHRNHWEKKKINVLRGFFLRVGLFTPIRGMGGGWGSWPPDWGG
jgi:hypothetical protein